MADIDIDVNPQQSPINISPNPQQNIIPVEVGEGTAPTYWGQILGDIDNQTDLKERLDSKQDTIVDLDKYLKNDTTQDNGLAIKGTVSDPAGTAVGDNASAKRAGVAIGRKAETLNYGVAIGGTDGNTITHASAASVAIGYGAVCNGSNAAQIGMGENTTGGTLQFQDYRLLNVDGTIPNDRIPQLSSKANTDLDNLTETGEGKFDAKADTDLANVLENIDYVIESQLPTAENNYTWYRLYRSGWCEQGGFKASSGNTTTVTLLKSFANTNYSILNTQSLSSTNDWNSNQQVISTQKTVSSFEIKTADTISDNSFYWEAKGLADLTN